ncbi:serine hydrolase domain-containing protein [Gemmatimonadota bacterium]
MFGSGTLFLAGLLTGCGADRRPENYRYRSPEQLSDGVEVGTPDAVGVDQEVLDDYVRSVLSGEWGKQRSLLIMKDDRLILEEYFGGWHRNARHEVQSISKSLTSMMVGRAIQDGMIASVEDPISHYLPEYRHLLQGEKGGITVRHLLTMTSGLEWDEGSTPYGDSGNSRTQATRSPDQVAFVLERHLASPPGSVWAYNGGGVIVLGEILRVASGIEDDDLVGRTFGSVMNPQEIELGLERDGRLNTAGGFYLTPRGLLKIGSVILNHGSWGGQQAVDSAWIEEATRPVDVRPGYGYLWWLGRFADEDAVYEVIIGSGYKGQYLILVPDLALAIVMNAQNRDDPPGLWEMLRQLLPAVTGRPITAVIWGHQAQDDSLVRHPVPVDSIG